MPKDISAKPWLVGVAIVVLLVLVLVIAQQQGGELIGAYVPVPGLDEGMEEPPDENECQDCLYTITQGKTACYDDANMERGWCMDMAEAVAMYAARDVAEEMGIDDPDDVGLRDTEVYNREKKLCDDAYEIYTEGCDALPGTSWCYENIPSCANDNPFD